MQDTELYYGIVMTKSEIVKIEQFKKSHKHKVSSIQFIVTPGAIGPGLEVQCTKCNVIKDITDVNRW